MLSYARSGGTLLNKCIESLPNVVMLSEVNPLASSLNVREPNANIVNKQAKEWYGIKLTSRNFRGSIAELYDKIQLQGKHLVIRDWSYINFTPSFLNQFNPPNSFLILETVSHLQNVKVFGFARDSIDVWLSSQVKSIDYFYKSYLSYLKNLVNLDIPIFTYENFCKNPDKVLNDICDYSGLEINNSFKNTFNRNEHVVGDTHMFSRGSSKAKIKVFKRKFLLRTKIKAINSSRAMIEANQLLGYPTSYSAVPMESIFEAGGRIAGREFRKLKSIPNRVVRKIKKHVLL